jgi:ABC-type antimicrobial peptide transport system permease subunit
MFFLIYFLYAFLSSRSSRILFTSSSISCELWHYETTQNEWKYFNFYSLMSFIYILCVFSNNSSSSLLLGAFIPLILFPRWSTLEMKISIFYGTEDIYRWILCSEKSFNGRRLLGSEKMLKSILAMRGFALTCSQLSCLTFS